MFLSNTQNLKGVSRYDDIRQCYFLLRLRLTTTPAADVAAVAGMVRLQARVGPEGVRLRRYPLRPIGGDLAAGHRAVQQVSDAQFIRRVAPPPSPLHTRHLVVASAIFHSPTHSRIGNASFVISSKLESHCDVLSGEFCRFCRFCFVLL